MYLLILFLPLTSAIVAGGLGRLIGRQGVKYYTISAMVATWITALAIYNEVVLNKAETYIKLWQWAIVDIGLQYDGLTAVMLIVVTSISALVHIYATGYMGEDPHLPRFMSYLSLFTWFMLVLVTADNLIQLFIGWEGVGVCSYLLINYWYTWIEANKSAMQAMIVNRVGDVGVVMAIIIIYAQFNSVEFAVIEPLISPTVAYPFIHGEISGVTIIGIMLLIGAMGKSAQIGLHIWLPSAMAGPTPVSALIHAATMVTAGVYLLLRTSSIIEQSSLVMALIAIVGALTAFFAATVGLVQNDIKKIIAYSTCSQLGYMTLACGIGAYSASIFHLYNHAFFKALLFLSAGAVIHAIGDEQDIRKMGGLITRLPFTQMMILVGSLALMGFPFLTGYYSKDAIIEMAYATYSVEGTMGHWLATISAMLTAFYSIRLLNIVFYQDVQSDKKTFEQAHEPSLAMSLPLVILAIASVFIGYVMKDTIMGPGSPYIEFSGSTEHHPVESEFISTWIKWAPVLLSFLGAAIAFVIYPLTGTGLNKVLFTFLSNKWHFDQIYNSLIVKRVLDFGHNITYKILDRGLIEELGPTGIAKLVTNLSKKASMVQSGHISHYSLTIIIGTVIMIMLAAQ